MAAAIAAGSALTIVLVIPAPFWLDIIGTIIVRVVDSCSYHLSSEVYLAATICAHSSSSEQEYTVGQRVAFQVT
eukprot:1148171-Pelagomonas_calceolata.AAC.1